MFLQTTPHPLKSIETVDKKFPKVMDMYHESNQTYAKFFKHFCAK